MVIVAVAVLALGGIVDGGIGVAAAEEPDDISIEDLPGNGTVDDPYLITNVSELQAIDGDLNASYELANDIDATETEEWNDAAGFDPIGNETDRFNGSFDGQGYTVSELTINRSEEEYVGLFGATESDADIEDVHIVDATVYGDENIGILAGYNNGSVIGSSGSGYVQAGLEDNIAGGLVRVGGLVGENEGTITESYATGDLYVPTSGTTSHYYIGGLIGDNAGEVTETFADVHVESNRGDGVGGLIGSTTGDVHNSFAVGDVIGRNDVGALIGDNNAEHVTVTTSYAAGHAEAHFTAAGLVGHNDGNAFGDGAAVSDSYWNRETTNQVDGLGNNWGSFTAQGMTTPEMVGDGAETEMSDLDFSGTWETVNASHEHADDDGYPILSAIDAEPQIETPVVEHLLDGTGTEDDPYQVSDVDDLQTVDEYQHRHYELTDDIDATETQDWNGGDGFDPIAEQGDGFSATFDGNGYTISGLTIDRTDDRVGLFSVLHDEAVVRNLTLEDVSVETERGDVGGLAGVAAGDVTDIHVTGEVHAGQSRAGGVIGASTGAVTNVSAAVEMHGSGTLGGLIGENEGPVSHSHAVGDVYSDSSGVGGLIGSDSISEIDHSYATGDVHASGVAGGLVGSSGAGTEISRSYATGDVYSDGSSAGGLIGSATGGYWTWNYAAEESYATGNVTGTTEIGGLVGYIRDTNVRASYAIGTVTAESEAGGLVGEADDAQIAESFATGSVQSDDYAGGAVGVSDLDSDFEDYVYWDVNATFRDVGVGDGHGYWDEVHGYTTEQMSGSSATTYLDALDFVDEWDIVTSSHEDAAEDRYPVLRWLNQTAQIESQAAAEADPSDAHFEVTITEIDEEVYEGQTVSFVANIENSGTAAAEQNISFLVNGSEINATSRILNSDGNTTVTSEYETTTSDLGVIEIAVESANESDSASVDVIEFASDTEAGDELWQFEFSERVESSPTIVDGTVYVGVRADGEDEEALYAVGQTTGEVEWTFTGEGRITASPLVVNETVYIGDYGDHVYALDAESGDEQWSSDTGDTVVSSPAFSNGTVYVGSDDGTLYALDAASGDEVWTFETGDSIEASPLATSSTVYIPSTDGHLYALDRSTGEEEWNRSTEQAMRSSPTLANGTLYYNDGGFVTAVHASTGEKQWEFAPSGERSSASYHTPTVADEKIYQYDRASGELYALNRHNGSIEWSESVAAYSGSRYVSPTVADDTVFIGGGEITALDATDGNLEWTFSTDANVDSSPTVIDGVLYVGDGASIRTGGSLYAIDAGVNGSSEDSRVLYRTLGHHDDAAAIASLETDPGTPVPGEEFTLTAENSLTFNQEITEYRWDVTGDGDTDEVTSEPFLTHEFSDAGTYEVGLSVTDDAGETASTSTEVLVSETGTLTGDIVDPDGDPVTNATIQVYDENVVVATAEPDSNGTYDLEVRTGTFTVEITTDEYIPHTVTDVAIDSDTTTSLDAELVGPGSGTEDDPYRVTTVEMLQDIQDDLDAYYVLWNDIDASETEHWNDGAGFEPIDDFTGTFDGQGHEISGLTIDRPTEDEVGLLGYAEGATVENLTLHDIDVTGENWAIGTVAGYMNDDNAIRNVTVSGSVTVADAPNSGWAAGGVVGAYYYGDVIEDVESSVNLHGNQATGGVVGEYGDSTMRNVTASGDIEGTTYSGGVIGFDWSTGEGQSLIADTTATGNITATGWGAGGLIGGSGSAVHNVSAAGNVTGEYAVGGLIGERYWMSVTQSSASGTVSGTDEVGGLIGWNDGPVNHSYTTSDVSADENVGGLIGMNYHDVLGTYASGEVTGSDQTGGLIGAHEAGNLTASYFDIDATNATETVGTTDGIVGITVSGLPTEEMTGTAAADHMAALDFDETWETVPDAYPRLTDDPTVPTDTVTVEVTAEPDVVTVGDAMTFDASNSSAQHGEIAAYHWDFTGDGEIDEMTESPETVHEYEQEGQYEAAVVLETDAGIVNATSVPAEVEPRTGTVTGTLVDGETGEPIPDATVSISELASNTTDEDGTYSLTVRIGTYRMFAFAQGYESATVDDIVVDEDEETVQDVELLPTLEEGITGTVVDEDDEVVANATTVLHDVQNQSIKAVTTTTQSGDYQFDVGPGMYRVLTTQDGYTATSSQEFILDDDEVEPLGPLTISPVEWDHTLSGAVTEANPDPVEGALVMLEHDETDDLNFAITAGDGSYEVGAMDGLNRIAVYDESLQTKSYELAVEDSMTEDIVLEETDATVSGQVTHEGEPVAGAGILAFDEDDVLVAETMSNSTGYYQFAMPAGEVDIAVFSEYGTEVVSESVDTGEAIEANVAVPAADAVLHGTVIDEETGQELPGIQIELIHPEITVAGAHAETHHDGQFTISEAPGEYELELTGDIIESHTETIEIESGETEVDPIEVTLHDDVEQLIDGTVLDDEDAPVTGAEVVLFDWGTNSVVDIAETDGDGNFAFSPEPGSYDVMTAPNGSWTTTEWVDLTIGETETVTLNVEPTERDHTVSATVEDRLSGDPIEESVLMVHSEGPATIGVTNESGSADLAVDAGHYYLEVFADDYLAHGTPLEVTENDSITVELFPHDATISANVTDEAGEPIPGVDIEPHLLADNDTDLVGRWSTDGDGLTDLELPAGEFEVVLFHEDYGYHVESIEVAEGEEAAHEITMTPDDATVSGQVINNATGDSFEHAEVILQHPDHNLVLDHVEITDGGAFDFQTGAGEFQLTAIVDDVPPEQIDVSVEPNESLTVDIELTPAEEPAIADYTTDGVVETGGLRDAVDDWRSGEIDTGLLRDVVGYWRSGEPVG